MNQTEDKRNIFKGIFAAGAAAATAYFFFDTGSFLGTEFSIYDIMSAGADETEIFIYLWCPVILAGLAVMFVLADRKEGYATGIAAIIAFAVSDICIESELGEMPQSMFLNFAGLAAMAAGIYKLNEMKSLEKVADKDKDDKTVPKIECLSGELAGAAILLEGTLVIGKDPQHCNLIVSAATCSRIHCEIKFKKENDKYVVKDVSTNGVYLRNGQRLIKNTEVELPRGTEIILANTNNVFRLN